MSCGNLSHCIPTTFLASKSAGLRLQPTHFGQLARHDLTQTGGLCGWESSEEQNLCCTLQQGSEDKLIGEQKLRAFQDISFYNPGFFRGLSGIPPVGAREKSISEWELVFIFLLQKMTEIPAPLAPLGSLLSSKDYNTQLFPFTIWHPWGWMMSLEEHLI